MKEPVSPADKIRQQLEKADLSQRSAARKLGIDERTMRRYCSGELPVPLTVTIALRWLGLVHGNQRVIELLDQDGARLKYVRADGGDTDITDAEKARLTDRNVELRSEAKKIVRKK